MTSRFMARRSAEEFAARVDAPAAGGHDDVPADLAPLLALVGELRDTEAPAPRADFSVALRERLMAEADTVLTPQAARLALPPRTRGARERRGIAAAASVAVLLGGSATMAAAAQDALPGEALYPVKRGLEQARSSLTFAQDDRGARLLDQAALRLAEAEALLRSGDPVAAASVDAVLSDFTDQASEGAELLLRSYVESGDTADATAVREFAVTTLGTVGSLAEASPEEVREPLTGAAVVLQELDRRAAELCAACGSADVVDLPPVLLAHAEVRRALSATEGVVDDLATARPVNPDASLGVLPELEPEGRPARRTPRPSQPSSQPAPAPAPALPGGQDGGDGGLLPGLVDLVTGGQQTKQPGKAPAPTQEPITPPKSVVEELGETVGDAVGGLLGEGGLGLVKKKP